MHRNIVLEEDVEDLIHPFIHKKGDLSRIINEALRLRYGRLTDKDILLILSFNTETSLWTVLERDKFPMVYLSKMAFKSQTPNGKDFHLHVEISKEI